MNNYFFRTVLLVVFISCFYGCANNSKFQYIDPEYSNDKVFSTTVLLMPLNNELIPASEKAKLFNGHKKKYKMFSQKEKKYFTNYFAPTFSEIATPQIWGIDVHFRPENLKFSFKELKKEGADNGFKMFVPIKGKVVYEGKIPSYVIFFEDLFFNKEVVADGGGLGRGSSSSISINSGLKYLIWDNKKEQIIAYGNIEKDFKSMDLPAKAKYLEIFEDYIKRIVKESPFRSKVKLTKF